MAGSRVNFTLHIGGRSSIRKMRTHHAVVSETHLPWNIPHIIKRRNAEWIGLLNRVIEGKIEVMRTQGSWRKRIPSDLQERRRYWNLEQETSAPTLRGTRFGRGYRPVVRNTAEWTNGWIKQSRKPRALWRINWYHSIGRYRQCAAKICVTLQQSSPVFEIPNSETETQHNCFSEKKKK